MQFNDWDQRLLDQKSGEHLDSVQRDRTSRAIRAGCATVGAVTACVYPECCTRLGDCRPAEIVKAALAAYNR